MAHTLFIEGVTPMVERVYVPPEDWHTTVLTPAPVIQLGIATFFVATTSMRCRHFVSLFLYRLRIRPSIYTFRFPFLYMVPVTALQLLLPKHLLITHLLTH